MHDKYPHTTEQLPTPDAILMQPYEMRNLNLGIKESEMTESNPVESTQLTESGIMVNGVTKAVIRVGGQSEYADVKIIDVSNCPANTGADGIVRRKVFDNPRQSSEHDYVADDYLILIPAGDGKNSFARGLTPGESLLLGRENNPKLPDTVSRQHAVISMDEQGKLVIQNLDPTNQTLILESARKEQKPSTEHAPTHDEAINLLSYVDVLDGDAKTAALAYNKANPSAQKYAETLREICAKQGTETVMQTARELVARMQYRLKHINVPTSQYGESISWALWDLAKQSYMAKHPDESSPDYLDESLYGAIGDPFDPAEAEHKQSEIVHRHVGWEIAAAIDQGKLDVGDIRKPLWIPQEKIQSILSTERNATGQLPSFALERLGRNAVGGM